MPTATGYAGAAVDDSSIGTVLWNDEAEAVGAPDAVSADATMAAAAVSHYLRCSTFGLSVSAGATTNSVTVTVRAKASRSSGSLDAGLLVRLKLPDGTLSPNVGQIAVPSDNTLRDYSFSGYSSNTFGFDPALLTEAVVEDATFSVLFYAQNNDSGNMTIAIDSVLVTLDYTPAVTFAAATMAPDQSIEVGWPPGLRRFCFGN